MNKERLLRIAKKVEGRFTKREGEVDDAIENGRDAVKKLEREISNFDSISNDLQDMLGAFYSMTDDKDKYQYHSPKEFEKSVAKAVKAWKQVQKEFKNADRYLSKLK